MTTCSLILIYGSYTPFLPRNWIKVVQAERRFDEQNIRPVKPNIILLLCTRVSIHF